MKTLTKILLLVLTLALSVTALAACGGDDGEVSYREVSADEWKAAFVFDNATMVSVEKIYSDGKVTNQYTSHVYFVDDYAYDANGIAHGKVSAYKPYFAFADYFGAFEFDSATSKYTCKEVTVEENGIEIKFRDVTVGFSEDGKLALVEFTGENEENDVRVTATYSDFGKTKVPEREAFVREGKDYCSYKNTRDLDGKKLAYITIKIKNYGNVKLVLDASVAPKTVAHFLKLVNEGFYDGLTFCRIIDDFMVQGGDPEKNTSGYYADADGNEVNIFGEFSKNGHENDIQHLRGVISMAREKGDDKYNSASSQFFICTENVEKLNGEYAAFGYVIEGMYIIDRMAYDAYIYGDDNSGVIYNVDKQPVIEKIVIDKLVGIELK